MGRSSCVVHLVAWENFPTVNEQKQYTRNRSGRQKNKGVRLQLSYGEAIGKAGKNNAYMGGELNLHDCRERKNAFQPHTHMRQEQLLTEREGVAARGPVPLHPLSVSSD